MKRSLLAAFLVSALGSGTVAKLTPAAAATTQNNYPAIMCNTRDVTQNTGSASALNQWGQAANINSSAALTLYCPIVVPVGQAISGATISFWSNGANRLMEPNIDGYSSVSFEVCEVFASGGGGSCNYGNGHQGGSGVYSLGLATMPFGGFDNQGNYDFLLVELGPEVGGSSNVLFGYQVSTNDYVL
jgi:hypothetical protein